MYQIVLDRIDFLDQIGNGSFGVVYGYKDKESNKSKRWAIKAVKINSIIGIVSAFEELMLGFSCDHPNLLPVRGCHIVWNEEENTGMLYLKSPRMKKSLDLTLRQVPLSEPDIIKIFYQLASALAYLHEKKIAHRDIKPPNVLIDDKGQIKLADLGLGHYVGDSTRSVHNAYAGSPGYMAPEVHESGLNQKDQKLANKQLFKTDMWSLGILLAELCIPRSSGIWKLIFEKKGKDKQNFLEEQLMSLKDKFSENLLGLIASLLRENPEERKSAEDLKQALEADFSEILGIKKPEELLEHQKRKETQAKSLNLKDKLDDDLKKPEEPLEHQKRKETQVKSLNLKDKLDDDLKKPEEPLEHQKRKETQAKSLNLKDKLDDDLLELIQRLLLSNPKERMSSEDLKKRLENMYEEMLKERTLPKQNMQSQGEDFKVQEDTEERRKNQARVEESPENMTEIEQYKSVSVKDEVKEIKQLEEEECKINLQNTEVTDQKASKKKYEIVGGTSDLTIDEQAAPSFDNTRDDKAISTKANTKSRDEEDYSDIKEKLEKMRNSIGQKLQGKFRLQIPDNPTRLMIEPINPNDITDENFTELMSSLKDYQQGEPFRKLKRISMSLKYCNTLSAGLIKQIAGELGRNCQELIFLELGLWGCTTVVDDVLKSLSDELRTKLTNLQTLGLFFNECYNITGIGVEKISLMIPHFTGLKQLKLSFESCKEISNESVKLLVQRIGKSLSDLRILELYFNECNNIEDDTVQEIAIQFINLKNLTNLKLILSYCDKINNKALVELTEKIGSNLNNLDSFELAVCGLPVSSIIGSMKESLKGIRIKNIHSDIA